MNFKTRVTVPKFLHEIHGEWTTPFWIVITYGFAILVTTIVILSNLDAFVDWSIWKQVLLILLLLDISGGIPANLSAPVKEYYDTRPALKRAFPALHILQPALLWLIVGGSPFPFLILFLYSATCCYLLIFALPEKTRNLWAVLLLCLGLIALQLRQDFPTIFRIFASLYLVKLLLCFSGTIKIHMGE